MRTARMLLGRLAVDGQELQTSYADVFVVVRDGESAPGPNDWEVTAKVADGVAVPPGKHELQLEGLDGVTFSGPALLRFSDGAQLLFRGDGQLTGFESSSA